MKTILSILLIFVSFQIISQRPGEISYSDKTSLPSGIEGKRIANLFATFNANDSEILKNFLNSECDSKFREFVPFEQHLDVFQDLYRRTGGLEFYSVRNYVPVNEEETVIIAKDRLMNAWHGISIAFEDGSQRIIRSIGFSVARAPRGIEEEKLTEAELIRHVDEMVLKLRDNDVFSGTVIIAKAEKELYRFACGEASKRFHVANDIDTKFNLGSMNKMFTSIAIMQLVEKNLLSLEDPISKYLDESWLKTTVSSQITIHHLLSHTSGLGSYFNEVYWKSSRENFRQLDDYKVLIKDDLSRFTPGTDYSYSNTGMFLLGVIIEKVTAINYFDYIRENIYLPAGMKNSDSYDMDQPVENLAIGYVPSTNNEWGWENNLYKHVIKGGPAGGGFSTAPDLIRFANALVHGKLVSKSSLDLMWTDHSGEEYGYGFGLDNTKAGKIVGHGGGFPGLNASLNIFLDKGYSVAVMSNYDRAASPVAQRIKEMMGRLK